jgi:hypothetical protein
MAPTRFLLNSSVVVEMCCLFNQLIGPLQGDSAVTLPSKANCWFNQL